MWDLANLLAVKRVLDSNVYTSSVSTVQHLESRTFLLWGYSPHSATIEVFYLFADIGELSLTCCSTSLHAGYDSATYREGVWHNTVSLGKAHPGISAVTGIDCSKSHLQWSNVCGCQSQRENKRLTPPVSVFCKTKMVLLKMWNKVVPTIFVGELLTLSFWLPGNIKYTICKYSAHRDHNRKICGATCH